MLNPIIRPRPKLLLSLLLLVSHYCAAETIQLRMQNGLLATADYLDAGDKKSPILILHGFLQTRDFFTVRRIADALHDEGYSVLLPNLSLGIDQRDQSLPCEAIHTHSMEQDRDEVALWVRWLYEKSSKPVTLIGHSMGSLTLLAYLDSQPDQESINQAFLISLIAFAQGPIAKENSTDKQRAEQDLSMDPNRIYNYRLAFCDRYPSRPDHYLSYLNWDQTRASRALLGLSKKPSIILGNRDNRLSPEWKPILMDLKANVIEIEGANHFFDHSHEFDLFDSIIQML
ncbi:MAG: alpha/beta hydrolase [Candidatus Thiodiazotropha lotti]|uniref:Alpha/beta hydrolase n=1 Tax=Candidatus Thiodiazotropha lotti TaxID=2792787 RepID=A0A9E4K7F1_9GAMM|nr:alpha/beta hydrolase [Candidatus Thiodiazotropha lotti]MCG7923443.1 alpha/beta hydrolase [Candidatus Thiodiazotropha lotti]MCG7931263.1 alpha/beta hydrolase [Candidatus Thiodiazotropha lotti]MCG7939764.1 alpha/beta hydrolase [Candidatus Thiodiazotropha lotti]MCG7989619.1 alpha/beta hydrolase [Candidatus Thiodiazotropha lotti]